jgi:hypothetical protein
MCAVRPRRTENLFRFGSRSNSSSETAVCRPAQSDGENFANPGLLGLPRNLVSGNFKTVNELIATISRRECGAFLESIGAAGIEHDPIFLSPAIEDVATAYKIQSLILLIAYCFSCGKEARHPSGSCQAEPLKNMSASPDLHLGPAG